MRVGDRIYFDHQASTPVRSEVIEAMAPYFAHSFANPHSSDHSLGWEASAAIDEATEKVAKSFGVDADEVIFTSGATEANAAAILGLWRTHEPRRGRILVSEIEHKSVLECSLRLRERHGVDIGLVPVDTRGFVDLDALAALLTEQVSLVSIMAVNNEIGTIQDISAISKLVRNNGSVFHCDATQAPFALDLTLLGSLADAISVSAHKMYGPKGVGALIMRRHLQGRFEPLIPGGGQQQSLRAGTLPVPLCVGMGRASDFLNFDSTEDLRQELRERTELFVKSVLDIIPGACVNGPDLDSRHPGNANIFFPSVSAGEMLSLFQPKLAASTGSACTSGIPQPSHVLRAIGLSARETNNCIRFSLGLFTTDTDVGEAVDIVGRAWDTLRELS